MKCLKCSCKVGENGAQGLCAKHYKQRKMKEAFFKMYDDFSSLILILKSGRKYSKKELRLFNEVNINLIGNKFTYEELQKCIQENNLQEYVDNLHKKAVTMLELAKKEEIHK